MTTLDTMLEWDGDAVVFDYRSTFGTFGVTGRVIERDGDTLRFEAMRETGPGIDDPEANWTGRLECKPNGAVLVWAEARHPADDDHLKGAVNLI